MLILLSMSISVRAILGLADVIGAVAIVAITIWYWWRKRRIRRMFSELERTGDVSKLDPDSRELVEQAMQARPDFAEWLAAKRPANERGQGDPPQ